MTFGKLTVISIQENRKKGDVVRWNCSCECGGSKIVPASRLVGGITKSCGCIKKVPDNIIGKRFGRLVVLSYAGNDKHRQANWLCKCDCGVEKVVPGYLMKHGMTKSCGCYRRDDSRSRKTKHGGCYTTEYQTWLGIKNRCTNPNEDVYPAYGGRGIKVCDRWLNSFENFLEDVGKKPSRKHSLDRYPDKNGNYEPGNCRWATQEEQMRNIRSNRWIECNGERMILMDWARRFGISHSNLRKQLKRKSMEDIVKYYSS